MEKIRNNHISIEEELSDYIRMFKALAINYLNVYLVEPEIDKGRIVKLNGYVTEGIVSEANDFEYSSMLKRYTKGRVHPDDLEYFLTKLGPKEIIKTFSDGREQMELSYRVIDNEDIHYYLAHYIRISRVGEPLRLVAGFRNVDQIVADRTKDHNLGMSKAYAALAKVYYSMFRVDVIKHTFTEIKTNEHIRHSQVPNTDDFDANAKAILNYVVEPTFVDEVLDFCSLDSLEERMKGKNSISIEFIGLFSGWVRASFIKEDFTPEGKLHHVLWAVQVIEDDKRRENELRALAEIDQLTGILNRGTGERKIKEIIKEKIPGIFCLMDVDHFKAINDTYGHEAGDHVIKEIARCLRSIGDKSNSIIMRLGGDEFAAFIPNINNEDEAESTWKDVANLFKNIHIEEDLSKNIFISAGCTFFNGEEESDFNTLYKKADDAMYKSKKTDGFKITFEK